MKNRNDENLPDITKRLKMLIDERFNGNILRFSTFIGLNSSSKVNRLFNKDKRNDTYPIPSIDIIIATCRSLECSADWLLFGKNDNVKTNNITITKNNVEGNDNITNSDNVSNANSELYGIIKEQQQQISSLINVVVHGQG